MRTLSISLCLAVLITTPLVASDITYGHPRELHAVTTVYVWSTEPPTIRDWIIAELQSTVPSLQLVEKEIDAEVAFVVKRRESTNVTTGEVSYVTSGLAVKSFGPDHAHLIMEPISHEADEAAAVREVTREFIAELQRANGDRFGTPPPVDYTKRKAARFRTTAGLRIGMRKKEVLEAVGRPSHTDGRATATQVWWYHTTDGKTRVVFRGESILAVQFIPDPAGVD